MEEQSRAIRTCSNIIEGQISHPVNLSDYVGEIRRIGKSMAAEPHSMTPGEGQLFALLYQAFFHDFYVKEDMDSAQSHLVVVKIIAKSLR